MAFTFQDSAVARGTGTTATLTPAAAPASGELVVLYCNRNGTGTISADAGGAAWTEAVNAIPPSETARHALFWKVANGSEPSAYGLTFGSSDLYQAILYVFSAASTPVVDAAATTHKQTGSSQTLVCGAANGVTIADNAVSLIFGGKDNRATGVNWTTADNSYTGVLGESDDQDTGGAYRIYTTGTTFSGNITITGTGLSNNDTTYSAHISFVEGAAPSGRIMSSLARDGGLAGRGGLAGIGGGLAG